MGSLSKRRCYLRDDWYYSPDHFKQLWGAVLQQALNDCISGPAEWELRQIAEAARPGIVQAVKDTAHEWVFDNSVAERTFLWVCANLEMDPQWLRACIVAAKEQGAN